MNELKLNPVAQIREEFASRYGLQPEDVRVSVTLWNVETPEKARKIALDYQNDEYKIIDLHESLLDDGVTCYTTSHNRNYREGLSTISVYSKAVDEHE